MPQTKITVKIYEPLLRGFDKQLDALHMKRDAFLNSMIESELQYLSEDMRGKRLSANAHRYIAGELKRLGTWPVNVVIDHATAKALNAAVKKTNMVRDAFINRLIMFLRSSDALLAHLELPRVIDYSSFESSVEPMPTSPLKAIEAVHADPLFYLRIATQERFQTGLYLLDLPAKLAGFTCYMDDASIPGTEAYELAQERAQKVADKLLQELESFEADAFRKTALKRG